MNRRDFVRWGLLTPTALLMGCNPQTSSQSSPQASANSSASPSTNTPSSATQGSAVQRGNEKVTDAIYIVDSGNNCLVRILDLKGDGWISLTMDPTNRFSSPQALAFNYKGSSASRASATIVLCSLRI